MGASCQGEVRVCVPHDQGAPQTSGPPFQLSTDCLDDGQTVNSLASCPGPGHAAAGAPAIASIVTTGLEVRGDQATLEYSLSNAAGVSLVVYDIVGRRVTFLEDGYRNAGSHRVSWDTRGLAAGIYFYRLRVGDTFVSQPVIIVK